MNISTEQFRVTGVSSARALPMILIALASFAGNSLVVVSVARTRSLRRIPGNAYILNLAISDIIASLLIMPVALVTVMYQGHWMLSESLCQVEAFLVVLCSNVTFLTLVFFSVYRYLLITSQQGHSQAFLWRRVKYSLMTIWVIGAIFGCPPLVGWGRFAFLQHYSMCTVDWRIDRSYGIVLFVFVFFMPQALMVHSYLGILKFIKTHNQRLFKKVSLRQRKVAPVQHRLKVVEMQPHTTNLEIPYHVDAEESSVSQYPSESRVESQPENEPGRVDDGDEKDIRAKETLGSNAVDIRTTQSQKSQKKNFNRNNAKKIRRIFRETKLVRVLLVTVVTFYICWLPFATDSLLQLLGHWEGRPKYFQMVAFWMASANAACNPIIYVFLNSQLRTAFCVTLRSLNFCCCQFRK